MFNMSEGIHTGLFTREKDRGINEYLLRLFFIKNKRKIEFAFFRENLVCSWNFNNENGACVEVLCLMSKALDIPEEKKVQEIFNTGISISDFPSYDEYLSYWDKLSYSLDIISKILEAMGERRQQLIKKEEFYKQLNLIKESFSVEFQYGRRHINGQTEEGGSAVTKSIQGNITNSQLSFMGSYFYTGRVSFDEILQYKLLEKIYGTNETESIYFKFRESGRIYTALTSYVREKGIFVTGVLGTYQEALYEEVLSSISSVTITPTQIDRAKRWLKEELAYIKFYYGEIFALYPFQSGREPITKMGDIYNAIDRIREEQVYALLIKDRGTIKVGVE
ncbi:hypothetical protein QA584_25780 [Anaerocolumna sp. AGMB13025]|uniref:hypothetical protein n=1 Tax=Anaerocolumna sp. AGMB13025 TaxID=3039116 RepID=UPI00241CD3A8|nr:hypothetical protein [Anaerocolumna sp. AGMB13025]WFR56986.1 hypothetical protein QA584_25780 [Anaerocolumna sp. AGMB13025]